MEYASNVKQVCKYFLYKIPMSNKKLQKMLYFAYSFYLVLNNDFQDEINKKLFKGNFEAWAHGPVLPEIYQIFKGQGSTRFKNEDDDSALSDDIRSFLDDILDIYGEFSANDLEELSHTAPWANARGGCGVYDICTNVIKDSDIFSHFEQYITNE